MTLFILGWYAVGFSGGWLAARALIHMNARYGGPNHFSRGHLFAVAFWAIVGPITWMTAGIWWACEVCDTENAKGSFWSKPVFGSREER